MAKITARLQLENNVYITDAANRTIPIHELPSSMRFSNTPLSFHNYPIFSVTFFRISSTITSISMPVKESFRRITFHVTVHGSSMPAHCSAKLRLCSSFFSPHGPQKPPSSRLTFNASFTWSSRSPSRWQIFSLNRCLSMVLNCSRRITESFIMSQSLADNST